MTKILDQHSDSAFEIVNGDCVAAMEALPESSIHFSLHSPPYLNLYVYGALPQDIGNASSDAEFWDHYRYATRQVFRVMKTGRIAAVDCANVPAMKERDGYIGLKDFRGDLIREWTAAGFIFHSEHCIWKDPLIEATRTKSLGLMHKQLMKDSAMCRAGIPQYLLAFRKPGTNAEPVAHEKGLTDWIGENPPKTGNLSHERWRRYASPVWMDVDFTNTLNARAAREEDDERHVCPFSLDICHRAIHLWSNPGDVVLDPFGGIGSTGYVAIQEGRRPLLIELKRSYYQQAILNLQSAKAAQASLFA